MVDNDAQETMEALSYKTLDLIREDYSTLYNELKQRILRSATLSEHYIRRQTQTDKNADANSVIAIAIQTVFTRFGVTSLTDKTPLSGKKTGELVSVISDELERMERQLENENRDVDNLAKGRSDSGSGFFRN